MKELKNIFIEFLSKNNIDSKSHFLIAVSGGIDSMVCLDIAKNIGLKIGVAHVNFKLRNKESDLDADLVKDYCKKENIPFHLLEKNAKGHASEKKLSIQEAARNIRYDFFNSIQDEFGYQYVITAHHLQDNIETFLMHLNRSAGLKGLTGIPQLRDNIIRPLLSVAKNNINEYAKNNNIKYRDDNTNKELKYDRNYIRNVILPSFYKQFPDFDINAGSTISLIKEDYSLLMALVQEKINPLVKKKGNSYHIQYNDEISELVWYHYLKTFGFNRSQIKDLVLNNPQSGKKFICKDFTLFVDRNTWIINENQDDDHTVYPLPINSSLDKPLKIICSSINKPSTLTTPIGIAYFDTDKLTFPLQLRKWLPGDRIKPIGMKGSKKVSDLLIDLKTSLPDKKRTYVLISNNEIIWVIGKKISAEFLVDKKTMNCCKISISGQ